MASNGEAIRTMEDYLTVFDPNTYLKDYFADFTGNQADFNGSSNDWDYLPSNMQFWFETFNHGKIFQRFFSATCLYTHTLIHACIYA